MIKKHLDDTFVL